MAKLSGGPVFIPRERHTALVIKCKSSDVDCGHLALSSEPDGDGHVAVEVLDGGEMNWAYIEKADSIAIINHLIEAFDLQPSDIGV